MRIHELKPDPGAVKRRKRVGRGHAAGQGKTCGRGQKGQKAREATKRGFEGGQNPAYKRVPKLRGQSNKAMNIGIFRKKMAIVNVGQLEEWEDGATITPELLLERGILKDIGDGVKVLGNGDLTKKLTVVAHSFSASARAKIEAAGGTVEVV